MADHLLNVAFQYKQDQTSGQWLAWVPALGNLCSFGERQHAAVDHLREAVGGYIVASLGLPDKPWETTQEEAVGEVLAAPWLTGGEVVAALLRMGFAPWHRAGDHHYLKHYDNLRLTTVPVYGETKLPGLVLLSILRHAGVTQAEVASLVGGSP